MKPGHITVHPGSANSFTIELFDGQNLSIGREPTDKDEKKLVLPFAEVSAQHAQLRCTKERWTIIDNASTNGTAVNGVRLSPGREYPLNNNDIVTIAQYELHISMPSNYRTQESSDVVQGTTQLLIDLIEATILVADIRNFSSLVEAYNADPSRIMQAANDVFDVLSQEIGKNDGQLEKISGDAIMAYWHCGATKSQIALSAYQACCSALQLKKTIEELASNKKYWPFANHPLMLDIAIASGPVASGALGHMQSNPVLLGDTANVAFRLEKLVDKPGAIVADGNTYSLVKERFIFDFLGDFEIKGRQKLVSSYLLLGMTN